MDRREFLLTLLRAGAAGASFSLLGCGREPFEEERARARARSILVYDTYAMALYFSGELGPKTGVVTAESMIAGDAVHFDFWHGHGGKVHKFIVEPEHFQQLKKLQKVTLETTVVDGHSHKLFIDPTSTRYRVPGAAGIPVPQQISLRE